MTIFFNKKEEVLDIELTSWGRSLLSVGQFKPVYYAFFDDDVLYDADGAAGIAEEQNNAEPRIQENTPSTKVQTYHRGIETNLSQQPPFVGRVANTMSPEEVAYHPVIANIDRNFSFIEPLGTMDLGSENAPAWNIRVLKGELSGAINYLTSSTDSGVYSKVRRIPQLDFDMTYRVGVGQTEELDPYGQLARENRVISQVYQDGTFLYLTKEAPNLILAVDEENSLTDLEYDIEVFEISAAPSSADDPAPVLTSLSFLKQREQVINGLLVEGDTTPRNTMLDSAFAEYFFLTNTDLEIPSEEICPVLAGVGVRGITLNSIPYDCKDVQTFGRFDIYGTNAVEEPCDDEN